jgi:hypothetical protein
MHQLAQSIKASYALTVSFTPCPAFQGCNNFPFLGPSRALRRNFAGSPTRKISRFSERRPAFIILTGILPSGTLVAGCWKDRQSGSDTKNHEPITNQRGPGPNNCFHARRRDSSQPVQTRLPFQTEKSVSCALDLHCLTARAFAAQNLLKGSVHFRRLGPQFGPHRIILFAHGS